jgi:antitoxin component YwqK of YwqJK toxin-antitoxin module
LKFTIYIFISLWLLTIQTKAQQDTTWYNHLNQPSDKENSSYFRPYPEKIGDLFYIKHYYKNGNLNFEGLSKEVKNIIFQGEVKVYSEDGQYHKTMVFENGILLSEKTTHNGGEYTLTYLDNRPDNGTRFYDGSPSNLTSYKDGKIIKEKTYYPDDKTLKTITNFSNGNKEEVITYNKSGAIIGKLIFENGEVKEGQLIHFQYNSPEIINKISYYSNFEYIYSDYFYSNGKPKSIINLQDPPSEKFYDKKGNILGEISYQGNIRNQRRFNGLHIVFFRQKEDSDIPKHKSYYQKGKVRKQEDYYSNGNIKKYSIYDSNGYYLSQEISFSENGDTLAFLEYKNHSPWSGLQINSNHKTWYEEGIKIKEIDYYLNSEIPFKIFELNKEEYYDRQGKLIATMHLRGQENYKKAYNGTIATHNDGLYDFFSYKFGRIVKIESNTRNSYTKKVFKHIKIYDEHSNSEMIREQKFFSNGQLSTDITYEYNKKKESTFYSISGELIGKYDYDKKDGILIKYFDNTDQMESYIVRKNDDMLYEKKFKENYYAQDGDKDRYFLFYEIDINKEAKFYEQNGKLRYFLTFKNQKPYSGKLYSPYNNSIYTYKNGKREGEYLKIETFSTPNAIVESGQFVNDKKEGEFKYFDYHKLDHTIEYKNDLKHGLSKYYNKEGEIISTIEYIDDKPYNGIVNKKKEKITYKNGIKTERFITSRYEGDKYEIIKGNDIFKTTYFPNSENIKYTYKLNDKNQLIDNITRYDKNGKVLHQAQMKDGEFVSGTLRIKNTSDYNRNVGYYVVNKKVGTVHIEIYQKDGTLLFKATNFDVEKNNLIQNYFGLSLINIYEGNLQ